VEGGGGSVGGVQAGFEGGAGGAVVGRFLVSGMLVTK
jgi:hypothetical protein